MNVEDEEPRGDSVRSGRIISGCFGGNTLASRTPPASSGNVKVFPSDSSAWPRATVFLIVGSSAREASSGTITTAERLQPSSASNRAPQQTTRSRFEQGRIMVFSRHNNEQPLHSEESFPRNFDHELHRRAFLWQKLLVCFQLDELLFLHGQVGLKNRLIRHGENSDQGAGEIGSIDLFVLV